MHWRSIHLIVCSSLPDQLKTLICICRCILFCPILGHERRDMAKEKQTTLSCSQCGYIPVRQHLPCAFTALPQALTVGSPGCPRTHFILSTNFPRRDSYKPPVRRSKRGTLCSVYLLPGIFIMMPTLPLPHTARFADATRFGEGRLHWKKNSQGSSKILVKIDFGNLWENMSF